MRPPVGGHFAADKAHLLRQVRTRAGGIELDFVAHCPAQQFVDRQANHFPEQIPQRQVDTGDGIHHQAAGSRVVKGGVKHLVMDQFDIADAFAFDKAVEMFFHDKAAHLPGRRHRKAGLSVVGFHFHNQRPQHVDAKRLPGLLILFIFAHRGGDMIVNPVVSPLVVVIAAAGALLCRGAADEPGADVFNFR